MATKAVGDRVTRESEATLFEVHAAECVRCLAHITRTKFGFATELEDFDPNVLCADGKSLWATLTQAVLDNVNDRIDSHQRRTRGVK